MRSWEWRPCLERDRKNPSNYFDMLNTLQQKHLVLPFCLKLTFHFWMQEGPQICFLGFTVRYLLFDLPGAFIHIPAGISYLKLPQRVYKPMMRITRTWQMLHLSTDTETAIFPVQQKLIWKGSYVHAKIWPVFTSKRHLLSICHSLPRGLGRLRK